MRINIFIHIRTLMFFLLAVGMIDASAQNKFPTTGNTGIGTANPQVQLHLFNGTAAASYPTSTTKGDAAVLLESSNNALEFGSSKALNARRAWILSRHATTATYGQHYGDLHIQPDVGDKQYYKGVSIGYPVQQTVSVGTHLAVNGRVGIGTTNPTEMLSVNGTIRTKEIKVEATNWADYVFDDNYQMKSLAEVEAFIKSNKHLPGIPNAADVKENGVELGEMNRKLLEKLEELTLHLIEKDKVIGKQQDVLKEVLQRLKKLEEK